MRLDVYAPLVASLLLGLSARPAARRLPPALAFRLLVGAGLSAAACWVWALGLLCWTAVGQLSFVAAEGHWSPSALRATDPVAGPVAWAAGVILVGLAATFVAVTLGRVRAVCATRALARQVCRTAPSGLVVVDSPVPEAFALPGAGRGRVVVSTAMLAALDPAERRVLFAHERAHLAGHHHHWLIAAQLAAAADPVLARLPGAVGLCLERAADEEAAAEVADRALAAAALCRAGLAALRAGPIRPAGLSMAYAAGEVRYRVDALLSDPPRVRWAVVGLVALLVGAALAGAVDAGRDTAQLFQHAIWAHWLRAGR